MLRRILEEGHSIREVARGFSISERTAHKSLARFKAEEAGGLDGRSSRPGMVVNPTAEY
jgi:transposase